MPKSDKIAVERGKRLSDKVINAAQKLLKKQFFMYDGFQSTVVIAANQGQANHSSCYTSIQTTGFVYLLTMQAVKLKSMTACTQQSCYHW